MEISGGMFGTIDIAVSGLKAQSRQMDVISSNIINVQTTDAGDGQPYRRLEAVLKADEDGLGGVQIADVVKDMSEMTRVLKPGHPDADAEGYVTMPNVDWANEMINLNFASRAYQANAAVLKRYQKMVETGLELLR
ncbi:MAG: flagellar basal body rod protein FlgC [Planctomycetes bacterium]|nr:flagellar basal body rod protein FlgC [Planctomycetota bacterium]